MRRYIDLVTEKLIDDPVERIVLSLRRRYKMSPIGINNGWCWGFAMELAEKLGPEAEVRSTTDMEGVFPGHSVVYFRGKYYDAESPQGVTDPRELAYSKRIYNTKD